MTQKITLTVDSGTADGKPFRGGAMRIVPSFDRLGDPDDLVLIEQAGVRVTFSGATSPTVDLFPNDLIGPQQEDGSPGWTYTAYYDGCAGNPQPWSFYLLSTNGATQSLSSLASTPAIAADQQYLPLPNTPPSGTSQVLGLSATSPVTTEWVDQTGGGEGGSGTVTSVAVESANGFAGTVADSTSTPQVTLKTTVNGMLKGNFTTGAVSAAAAGTDYLAPAGSGAALTGITAAQVGADASGAAAAAQAAAEAYTDSETARAEGAEALKAPLASPAFTGTPTAPTPSGADNSTKIATTAFVQTAAAAAQSAAEAASDAAGSAATAQSNAESYADTNKLAKSADLSDVASASTARTNLGLGTAATHASADFDAAGTASSAQAAAESYADGLQPTSGSPLPTTKGGTGLSESTAAALVAALGALLASNNLSDLASASTARTNLGLGTAATEASSAFDASGAASTAQSTAESYADTNKLAKSSNLSDLASASTARTNLGLGTAATQNSTAFDASGAAAAAQSAAEAASVPITGGTMEGWLAPDVDALSQSAGSVAVNAELGNAFNLTLTASGWTIANPTNAVDGQVIRFRLSQDSSGSRTVSWGTAYDFGAGSAPTLTTTASKVDIVAFEYVASISKWCCLGSGLGF